MLPQNLGSHTPPFGDWACPLAPSQICLLESSSGLCFGLGGAGQLAMSDGLPLIPTKVYVCPDAWTPDNDIAGPPLSPPEGHRMRGWEGRSPSDFHTWSRPGTFICFGCGMAVFSEEKQLPQRRFVEPKHPTWYCRRCLRLWLGFGFGCARFASAPSPGVAPYEQRIVFFNEMDQRFLSNFGRPIHRTDSFPGPLQFRAQRGGLSKEGVRPFLGQTPLGGRVPDPPQGSGARFHPLAGAARRRPPRR